jgi:hypothetical protein
MKGSRILAAVGAIIIAIGIILAIYAFATNLKNPSKVAEYTVHPPDRVLIKKGTYDIWYENTGVFETSASISIDDEAGTNIMKKSRSETITVNDVEYHKAGTMEVDQKGYYNISSSDPCIIYITPPLNIGSGFKTCFMYLGISGFGAILLLVGIYLETRAPPPPDMPMYSPPHPSQIEREWEEKRRQGKQPQYQPPDPRRRQPPPQKPEWVK